MSNTVLIKEVNNQPVIFNVDNAADGTALEQLGALKMPESLVEEIFGENARHADNTTCTITDNPDNAEFPFTVQFDSSKIPEKPKRNTETLAVIGMPGEKYIDINPTFRIIVGNNVDYISKKYEFNAPDNGFIKIFYKITTPAGDFYHSISINTDDGGEMYSKSVYNAFDRTSHYIYADIFPVLKNKKIVIFMEHRKDITILEYAYKFIYLQEKNIKGII